MSGDPRVRKSLEREVCDLDAHLFLLRSHLHELNNSSSHLKVISAELRTLVCFSGKVEGLLWRLTESLSVDDSVFLSVPSYANIIKSFAPQLDFAVCFIYRGDKPHPVAPHKHSLKRVIKEAHALVVMGKSFTHQKLISAFAQQMGTSHEAEKVDRELARLSSFLIGNTDPFVHVLKMDAELVLEVGERILQYAERKTGFVRRHHSHDYGNFSFVARFNVKQRVSGPMRIFRLGSYVASVEINCYLTPTGFELLFKKHGSVVSKFVEPFPEVNIFENDVMYVFSYSSRVQQARTFSDNGWDKTVSCNLGWVHASELTDIELVNNSDAFELGYFFIFKKLLSSHEVYELMDPYASGLFISEEEELPSPTVLFHRKKSYVCRYVY